MALGRIGEYLRVDLEAAPGYQRELIPSIHAGLYAIAAAEVALGVFLLFALWPHSAMPAIITILGLGTAATTLSVTALKYGRWVAMASVWVGVGLLSAGPEHDYVPVGETMLVLTAAATVPLPALRALLLGLGSHVICVALIPASPTRHAYFIVLTALAAVVALVRTAHRSGRFLAHMQAMKENEILSTAQLRAQLSENAVSVARLAAALTHEVNSPLGALKSAVDTLVSVSTRCAAAPPEERGKLVEVEQELQRSVQDSAARLQAVIVRLQRFADVEQSDLQQAEVGDLVHNASLRLDEQLRQRGQLELRFQNLPPIICRPQQLTTVFASVLSNAFHALNGSGKVVVTTERQDHQIEVVVRDNGRGMSAEELDHIFDPGFRVNGSRVSTGNWSLFSARQVLYEHGGDIIIDSASGQGTTVRILLPA
jgi:signal transduction histidine kinase